MKTWLCGHTFVLEGCRPRREPDFARWMEWLRHQDNTALKETEVVEGITVLTFFPGFGHPGKLFNTLILTQTEVAWEGEPPRFPCYNFFWPTYAQAMQGHETVVADVRGHLKHMRHLL